MSAQRGPTAGSHAVQLSLLIGGLLLLGAAILPWVSFNPRPQLGPDGAYLPLAVKYVGTPRTAGAVRWSASGPGVAARLVVAGGAVLAVLASLHRPRGLGLAALVVTAAGGLIAALGDTPIPAPAPYDRFWQLEFGAWSGLAGATAVLLGAASAIVLHSRVGHQVAIASPREG